MQHRRGAAVIDRGGGTVHPGSQRFGEVGLTFTPVRHRKRQGDAGIEHNGVPDRPYSTSEHVTNHLSVVGSVSTSQSLHDMQVEPNRSGDHLE